MAMWFKKGMALAVLYGFFRVVCLEYSHASAMEETPLSQPEWRRLVPGEMLETDNQPMDFDLVKMTVQHTESEEKYGRYVSSLQFYHQQNLQSSFEVRFLATNEIDEKTENPECYVRGDLKYVTGFYCRPDKELSMSLKINHLGEIVTARFYHIYLRRKNQTTLLNLSITETEGLTLSDTCFNEVKIDNSIVDIRKVFHGNILHLISSDMNVIPYTNSDINIDKVFLERSVLRNNSGRFCLNNLLGMGSFHTVDSSKIACISPEIIITEWFPLMYKLFSYVNSHFSSDTSHFNRVTLSSKAFSRKTAKDPFGFAKRKISYTSSPIFKFNFYLDDLLQDSLSIMMDYYIGKKFNKIGDVRFSGNKDYLKTIDYQKNSENNILRVIIKGVGVLCFHGVKDKTFFSLERGHETCPLQFKSDPYPELEIKIDLTEPCAELFTGSPA